MPWTTLSATWRDLRIDDLRRRHEQSDVPRLPLGLAIHLRRHPPAPQVRSLVTRGAPPPPRTRARGGTERRADGNHPTDRGGRTRAVALTASSYTTGQSVTWVQGAGHGRILTWEGSQRESVGGPLCIDHVMASAALPFFFPAVEIGGSWYGDGDSGPRRLCRRPFTWAPGRGSFDSLPTHARRTRQPAGVGGYPPPAEVAGVLMNAIFLDLLDADAQRLQQLNEAAGSPPTRLAKRTPTHRFARASSLPGPRAAGEPVRSRPASALPVSHPGIGQPGDAMNDLLSLLMFQPPDYIARLIELGEADARERLPEIRCVSGSREGTVTMAPFFDTRSAWPCCLAWWRRPAAAADPYDGFGPLGPEPDRNLGRYRLGYLGPGQMTGS